MAGFGSQWNSLSLRSVGAIFICSLVVASMTIVAEARLKQEGSRDNENEETESDILMRVLKFLWQKGQLGYTHVWPVSLLLIPWALSVFLFLFISCLFYE